MRKCIDCKITKTKEEFNFKDKKRGLKHSYCRMCQKIRQKKHYEKNKPQMVTKARKNKKKQVTKLFDLIALYKLKPCMDCNRCFEPWLMEFDHRSDEDKVDNVSTLLQTGISEKTLFEEIKKCDLVCAMCHRKRTFSRQLQEGKTFNYTAEILTIVNLWVLSSITPKP
jgi:hypothetical protein